MSADTTTAQFQPLADAFADEVVTHSLTTDVALPAGAGTMALITLDNGQDHRRPTTLGPNTLVELGRTLEGLAARAAAGEIVAVGITGKPHYLVAGADLSATTRLSDQEQGRQMARLGHHVYGLLTSLGVPSFVFINGVALGGGLEIALNADYRTVSTAAGALALPEVYLGLVPGWGGIYLLPRLIGPAKAEKVIFENALANNRTLTGPQAAELGIADALFEGADFLEQSLTWAAGVLTGTVTVTRPDALDDDTIDHAAWDAAVAKARAVVTARTSNATPAPQRALELFDQGRHRTKAEAFAAEDDALAELITTPEFQTTVYGFLELVQKRAKRPAGAPDAKLARPVTKVGVVGAGLMASQLALLFARRLTVPVVMTDVDQARVDKGVAYVHAEVAKLKDKGRISTDAANRITALVTGTVDKGQFADADFVIEAVFEELSVKKQVFAEVEAVVREDCILATNTSSLSVTAMAEDLAHPERVVGFHFFNPVAVLPLLEIVRAPKTDDAVLATAFAVAKGLKKNAVLVTDSAAFVVNRVLGRMFGEITKVFDEGTDAHTADTALAPMGLPMTPFALLALVGLPVGAHVQESLQAAFGDRFHVSANQQRLIDAGRTSLFEKDADGNDVVSDETLALLEVGDTPSTAEQVLTRTQDALADEIRRMLDEGVVAGPEDIDLCMILGAGWPLHLGGITPYLDRVGASERVTGRRFHADQG
ncbi:3-hydroxyacyl-CoA dehydrogenase NAD-binding domain-containing protein [Tersicoccus sp. Bi-70]|uniref:3-hydroxyacyl-CoA dehydrogenase NAD-binding domain-containing protein n=1 Tax=Tersicoccus sp. Bi-70 TaxID=1897634 RepID=UPI00097645B6|nr:3-hydroxyacyl-CoA dehydrogenase NAD-binding domain-containing protein [Tersicoccus sp. Bi-70]OMH33144.1 3-hydroxyacyl-CoA dehydrogenase [Tersicoccus sp. Bi-70]